MFGRLGCMLPKRLKSYMRKCNWTNAKTSQQKASKLKGILAQNTDEFCKHTTLHGLKYVGSEQLYPTERCFFGVSIVVVLLLSSFFILKAYNKWATTPVIVGINPVPTFITNEPFPAVTVCNLNQALKSKASRLLNHTTAFATLQLLCQREFDQNIADTISDWTDLERFIMNISQPCERMLVACRFGGRDYNCSEIFFPIVTDEGLCCVFNMLHPSLMFASHIPLSLRNITAEPYKPIDWYAEQGYPADLPPLYYPRTTAAVGESMGLSLILDVEYNEYYCSSSNSVGFKLALHSPNEAPNVRETGVLIEPGRESKIRVHPEKTETDRRLRFMAREYRRCVFHDEGRLRYFAHYTQRNCECECVSASLQKHCGCIGYYMPRVDRNASTCNIQNVHCLERVRLRIDPTIRSCLDDCLPSCFDLSYVADVFTARLSHDGFKIVNEKLQRISHHYVRRNIAVVNFYFNDYSFRSKIQTEFIGIADFLSSVGGLMGLFLGFSFISIAELLYFGILRPCRAFFQQRRPVSMLPTRAALKLSRQRLPSKRKAAKIRFEKPLKWQSIYKLSHPSSRQASNLRQTVGNKIYIESISGSIQHDTKQKSAAPISTADAWVILNPIQEVWQEE